MSKTDLPHHAPIPHLNNPMRGGGNVPAVRDHDDGRAMTFPDLPKKFHHQRAGFRVEITGRLISQ